MTNLYIECKCGKTAYEADWKDDLVMDAIYDRFGSLDDYYFFPCTCGEINPIHYTGYDNLIENLEYEMQLTDELKFLSKHGEWCIKSGVTKDVEKVAEYVQGFKEFHTIESYETTTYFRKGFSFKFTIYNPIHQNYQYGYFRAYEKDMDKLIAYYIGK